MVGTGISIDSLDHSFRFLDLAGNGEMHRTAWAGKGTGVLVLDADGNGKISRSSEFAFTEWDQTARSDLEAIKNVFDTNHNGKLDAGDARWSEFKVEVDGQLVSLDSLGITSIDLIPTGSGQTFADGSSIGGTTTFTRADGTTGTVGDAKLVADATGHLIDEVSSLNPDGSSSREITGYSTDGRLRFRNIVTTSADGNSLTTSFDDDGNGTFDRSQSIVHTVGADGSRSKTVSNYNADGSLASQTVTTTSPDQSVVTTTLDRDGDGAADERQVFEKLADGSTRTTTQSLSYDGTVIAEVVTTAGADGLTKQTVLDADADGNIDEASLETTVVGPDGGRTVLASNSSRDGALLNSTTTEISADSRSRVITEDLNGDELADVRTTSQTTVAADGATSTASIIYNQDGTVRGGMTSTRSADGLLTSSATDVDGDQITDIQEFDQTTVVSDGSRTQVGERRSSDGTLLSRVETSTSADGRTISEATDANGDGAVEATSFTTVAADGTTTKTETLFAEDGSVISSATRAVSSDSAVVTTAADIDGNGVSDLTSTVTKSTAADGSVTEVTISRSGDGTLLSGSTVATSADSLTAVRSDDVDGDGDVDQVTTDAIILHADGSRSQSVTVVSQDGSLQSRTVVGVSADRRTTTGESDVNGDGAIDVREVAEVLANGDRRTTVTSYSADGSVISAVSSVTNAPGFLSTTQSDLDGDGTIDRIVEEVIEIAANGDRTWTSSEKAGDGTLVGQIKTVTGGNGFTKTTTEDVDGDGDTDRTTAEVTILNSDGSSTKSTSTYAGSALVERVAQTVAANGLSVTTEYDRDGDGNVDLRSNATSTIAANGSSTTIEEARTAAGQLLTSTAINVSADKATRTTTSDLDGDGSADIAESITVAAAGGTLRIVENLSDGEVVGRVSETVSATKLSKSTSIDRDGDGIADRLVTEVTSLQGDGSTVVTRSEFGASGLLNERMVTTRSADGLTENVSWQVADGSVERSRSSTKSIGADGSVTETLTYRGAGEVLESNTQTTTSAHGLEVATTRDSDGDGLVDQHITTTRGSNGSVAEVYRDVATDGATLHARSTNASADGLTRTTEFDGDGDGLVDKRVVEETTLNADGSTSTSIGEFAAAGGLLSLATEILVEASADGLSIQTTYDLDGDGDIDRRIADETALNADGSTFSTITRYAGSTLEGRYAAFISANGLVKTTEVEDATGTIERSTDVTALNADGTKTRTITNSGSAGESLSQQTITQSADGRTITLVEDRGSDLATRTSTTVTEKLADGLTSATTRSEAGVVVDKVTSFATNDGRFVETRRDADGDGTVDQLTVNTIRSSGLMTSVTTDFAHDGSVANRSTTTTSADGRTVVTAWDSDGDGDIDRRRTQVNTAFADGSSKSVISDVDAATGTLASQTVSTRSADGRLEIVHRDVDGDGAVDQTATRLLDASGAASAVIENNAAARDAKHLVAGAVNWKPAIAAQMESETSADGRETVTRYDYDGDGRFEVTSTAVRRIDGSVVTTYSEAAATGAVVATGTSIASADGEVTTLLKDENDDGNIDLEATSSRSIDGSRTLVTDKLGAGGALLQRTEEQVSAFGQMFQRSVKDGLGRLTSLLAVARDGSARQTTYDAGSGALLTQTEIGSDGFANSAVLYDPQNANPWSRIEQTFNAQGKKTSEKHFLDDGKQVRLAIDAASGETSHADYYNAGGVRTSSIDYDVANADSWSRLDKSYDGAGRLTNQTTFFDNGTKTADTFDAASGQKLNATAYTAAGVISKQFLYDPLNTATWLRIERTFDASGRKAVEQQYRDDGTRARITYAADLAKTDYIDYYNTSGIRTSNIDYDVRNAAAWERRDQTFDTSGRVTKITTYNDDDSKIVDTRDPSDAKTWSSYVQTYNAAGQLVQVSQVEDNGTIFRVKYDPTNAASWTRVEYHYDAQSRPTSTYIFYDSKERAEIAYDTADAKNWESVTVVYTTAGVNRRTTTAYDDGTSYTYDIDVEDKYDWYDRESWYAANGVLERQAVYTSSNPAQYKVTIFDAYNNKEWTKKVQTYEDSRLISETTLGDDGISNTWTHPWYRKSQKPVLFDLNADGVVDVRVLASEGSAGPRFDWDSDGMPDETAWVGPNDGLLVIDLAPGGGAGAHGSIDQAKEIAFAMWPEDAHENPVTDLEGLRIAFDTNHDNILDHQDARWAEFRVWQDLNQNGISDGGELKTLTEAGIKLIGLLPTSEGATAFADGSAISGTSYYETVNGTTHLVADASFRYRPTEQLA